jgi:hypothetical protein
LSLYSAGHALALTVKTICKARRKKVLSSCWAGDVRWRDEKIEIALSRSSFPSGGHFSPASSQSGNISRSNGICCALHFFANNSRHGSLRGAKSP